MDLFFIGRFLWGSMKQGRIPIYSDFSALSQLGEHGWYAYTFFSLSLLLFLSIVLSAYFFLSANRYARIFAYIQTPFRIIMAEPSLAIIPWLPGLVDSRSFVLKLLLILGSELLKLYTLQRYGQAPGHLGKKYQSCR